MNNIIKIFRKNLESELDEMFLKEEFASTFKISGLITTFFEQIYKQAQQDLIDKLAGSAHPYCECNNGLNAYELTKGLCDGTYTTKTPDIIQPQKDILDRMDIF